MPRPFGTRQLIELSRGWRRPGTTLAGKRSAAPAIRLSSIATGATGAGAAGTHVTHRDVGKVIRVKAMRSSRPETPVDSDEEAQHRLTLAMPRRELAMESTHTETSPALHVVAILAM